ncbi:MAG: polyprenyl synthetase family protein, partial [Cyanobacteria bacterium P01_D01_bin.56]
LGMAFQVIDDILDYTTSTATLGKEQGNDIQEGKMTLPLIYFLETASTEQQQQIRNAIENPTQEVDTIIEWVNQSDALQRCQQVAKNYQKQACQALQTLPASAIKQTLIDLSHFAIARIF